MLRRILALVMFSCFLFSSFASPVVADTSLPLEATSSIVWNTNGANYYSVWFSDTEGGEIENAKTTDVDLSDNTVTSLYLNYVIVSNCKVEISIQTEGPMTSSNGGNIDWTITCTVDGVEKEITKYATPETIVTYEPSSKVENSLKLSLAVESVSDMDLVVGNNTYKSAISVFMGAV